MTEVTRPWKTRHADVEYGPYSDAEMVGFIGEGRIVDETEVQHPRFTQGLWMKARAVGPLRKRLEKTAPPPIQQPPQSSAQAPGPVQEKSKSSIRNFLVNYLSVPPSKLNRSSMFVRMLLGVYLVSLVLCVIVTPLMVYENSSGPIAGNVIRVLFNITLAPVLFTGLALVYFVPSWIAYVRDHRNAMPIFVLNLCFGWTFVGWAVCLAWAFSADVNAVKPSDQSSAR